MRCCEESLLFFWDGNVVCWRNYVSEVSTVRTERQGGGKKFFEFGFDFFPLINWSLQNSMG